MFRILVIARDRHAADRLRQGLTRDGYACPVATREDEVLQHVADTTPDLILLEDDSGPRMWEISRQLRQDRSIPVVAMIDASALDSINGELDTVDDFVIRPCQPAELELRLKRLLRRDQHADETERIRCGDLTIDLAKCEVSVGGRALMLTFKEYQLLKFLAANPGRVFTREMLLNKVWGYDYFGGDRTVDVHIKRLRSKIEDATHTFIETVRNIGYRFRADLP